MQSVLNLVAKNQPQVMPRILRLLTCQGLLYQNLWVKVTDDAKFLTMTIEARDHSFSDQLVKLLEKLVDVVEVHCQVE